MRCARRPARLCNACSHPFLCTAFPVEGTELLRFSCSARRLAGYRTERLRGIGWQVRSCREGSAHRPVLERLLGRACRACAAGVLPRVVSSLGGHKRVVILLVLEKLSRRLRQWNFKCYHSSRSKSLPFFPHSFILFHYFNS